MNAWLVHGWVTMAEVRRAVRRFIAAQKPLSNDTWYSKLTNLFIYYLMRSEIGVSVGHCCVDQDIQDGVPQLSSVIVFVIWIHFSSMSFYNEIEIKPRSSYYGSTGSVNGEICNFFKNKDIQYGARQLT